MTQKKLIIEDKKINLNEIDFWPDNPRLLEYTRSQGDLTPIDIKNYFLKDENIEKFDIKKLATNILELELLHDPLQLQKNSSGRYLLFEGNRRLAALNYLKTHHAKDKIVIQLLSEIRCTIYLNLEDKDRDKLLANWHEEGKLEWTPFARGLKMKNELKVSGDKIENKGKYSISEMEEIYNKNRNEIYQIIDATNFILKKRLKSNKFSHALELQKVFSSTKKFKALEFNNDDIKKLENKIAELLDQTDLKGADIRVLGKINSKPIRKRLKQFLNGEIEYNEITEFSKQSGLRDRLVNKFEKIANDLLKVMPETEKRLKDKKKHETSLKLIKKIKIIKSRLESCVTAYKNRQ